VLSSDQKGTHYRDLLSAWVEVLRAWGVVTDGLAAREASAPDGAKHRPPPAADPQIVSLLAQMSLLFVTSGVRYWMGAAEAFAKLLPVIDLGLGAAGEDPTRLSAARAALIDELRGGLRSLTTLSSQESRRVLIEFENIVQQISPAAPSEKTGEYWRRWTVKP